MDTGEKRCVLGLETLDADIRGAVAEGPNGVIRHPGVQPSYRYTAAISAAVPGSDFGLLREDQRVVNLNAEVANRALQLGMAEEQLAGSDVAGAFVDQRDLCTA